MSAPALDFLAHAAARVESALGRALPDTDRSPPTLHAAMRYGVLGGGKRLRPALVYAAAAAVGVDSSALDTPAAAVEIIHAYSLIHDDLPAMDDDELRRGKATCHIAYGEAEAILAGDALQALAFELLAGEHGWPARAQLAMLRLLARACGSHGMAGGQASDLAAVGQTLTLEELERMHRYKTGELIRASVLLGALASGCEESTAEYAALNRYGEELGFAFQIHDDVLDVLGDTAVIGKPQGSDHARGKPTYPALIGVPESQRLARLHRDHAIAALAGFDARADLLRALASYVVERES
ncbi:MAG: polyprenyl synthetase family protein [Xanthomonadales bacterium]|nr:polyprenyl synthetase family protein [Xanthomonadales bacterium]